MNPFRIFLLLVLCSSSCLAQKELVYPRLISLEGNSLKIHHPVIDRWDGFAAVEGWIPVEVRLKGSDRPWVGAVRARAKTDIDLSRRVVSLTGQEVLQVRFSDDSAPPEAHELARQAVRSASQVVMLDDILQALAPDFEIPPQAASEVQLGFRPPRIVVSDRPLSLLLIDKQPVQAPISGTGLEFVVNTDWQLFFDTASRSWYVLNQGIWQTNSLLASGGWTTTDELPEDFRILSMSDDWPALREAVPARIPTVAPKPFLISLEPAELIVVVGEPALVAIGKAGLNYVANADRDLFELRRRWYFLVGGRWFESAELEGQWKPVDQLPSEFSSIPKDHAKAHVRATVPGTDESLVAMMEATLPRKHAVSRDAGSAVTVGYVGPPQFEPIEGTSLERAVNSPYFIFRHNNFFYLCYEAAWYMSRQAGGPWSVALAVPEEIYRIPATDPSHIVTYVRALESPPADDGKAYFTYNSGYLGEYNTSVSVVQGTGWYYSPWLYHHPMGYPVYWSYPHTYGWHGRAGGRYNTNFHHYGSYWGSQTITIESPPRGIYGPADPVFQDEKVARRGTDYSTLAEQRSAELQKAYNAGDDYYTDTDGDVYRRSDEGWSQHDGDGWSTMADLQHQYGGGDTVGQVEAVPQGGQQAYKQNQQDIERMERYYQSRQRNYNMSGYVYTR